MSFENPNVSYYFPMVSLYIDVEQKIISAIDFGQHELKSSNCPVRDKKKKKKKKKNMEWPLISC